MHLDLSALSEFLLAYKLIVLVQYYYFGMIGKRFTTNQCFFEIMALMAHM